MAEEVEREIEFPDIAQEVAEALDIVKFGEMETKAVGLLEAKIAGPEAEFQYSGETGGGRPIDVYYGIEGTWKIFGMKPPIMKVKLEENVVADTTSTTFIGTEGRIMPDFCTTRELKQIATVKDWTLYAYFPQSKWLPKQLFTSKGVAVAISKRPWWKIEISKEKCGRLI